MNGVLGMMELVLEGDLSDKQRRCLELSKQSAGSLLTVINDILDISKIEAGKLTLANITFSLRDCLQNTTAVFQHQADDKHVDLMLHIHPDVPDSLTGDPGRLRQILTNLVGNALKFTERGWVAVNVTVISENNQQVELAIAVTDTGSGIPEDKQALVFEAFEQVDSRPLRELPGTGLGLSISTQLVAMMGGQITLDSVIDQGSTFRFTVVFGVGQPQVTKHHDGVGQGSLSRCRALVVTANDTHWALGRQALGDAGARCTCIAEGKTAIAEVNVAVEEGKPFQVVLLDSDIPDMDSFKLAEGIRQVAGRLQTPMIMLTSVGLRGDADKCRETGIAAYLVAPFEPLQLLEAVTGAIRSSSSGDAGSLITRHTLREHQGCLRILVAEDNHVNREHVTLLLEDWGHTVVCVENGRQALDRTADELFDIILMDMEMPVMDGLDAAIAIRAAEKTTGLRVPIIAMTANVLDTAKQQCHAAGMDAYVPKPMSGQSLRLAIKNAMSVGIQPALVAGGALLEEGRAGASPTPEWDAAEALGHVDGNLEGLLRIVRVFLEESSNVMAEIHVALNRRDGQGLRRLGHKFKGSLGLVAAGLSRTLAEKIETAGRDEDWPVATGLVTKLDGELESLHVRLSEFVSEKQTSGSNSAVVAPGLPATAR